MRFDKLRRAVITFTTKTIIVILTHLLRNSTSNALVILQLSNRENKALFKIRRTEGETSVSRIIQSVATLRDQAAIWSTGGIPKLEECGEVSFLLRSRCMSATGCRVLKTGGHIEQISTGMDGSTATA